MVYRGNASQRALRQVGPRKRLPPTLTTLQSHSPPLVGFCHDGSIGALSIKPSSLRVGLTSPGACRGFFLIPNGLAAAKSSWNISQRSDVPSRQAGFRFGLGPGTGFASLTTLGSRVTLIPPSDGIVRPMMLSHRRVRCKTLRPHDCPLALISLSPKRVPPLGAFSFAERKAHGNTTMVERPRRSRALVGCSERVLAVENGPQSLSLTAANKTTIPNLFTTASETLSVG
jgi:hypothetical protein